MIIAFGHKKQQGKDTAVQAIVSYIRKTAIFGNESNPLVFWASFAQPLYEICGMLIPEFQSKEHYDNHPEEKEVPIPRLGRSPRQLLIAIGQNLKSILGPDCFAIPVAAVKIFPQDVLLISDLRFPCEAEVVQAKGGVCVKVVRPDNVLYNDEVDSALDDWDGWDYVLVNDCSLEQFEQKAISLYKQIKLEKGL